MSDHSKIEWTDATWVSIPGYDDYVINLSAEICGPSGKVMKQMKGHAGHLYVLCNRGKHGQRKLYVHRAMLLAFVGDCPANMECRHLDGDPANNCIDNLEWGSRQQNADDRKRHGRMPIPHESKSTRLRPCDIPSIRKFHGVLSSRRVSEIYGTSHTTILKIWRNERWKGY